MATATTIPVSITHEAGERIQELGVHAPLESMLQYAKDHIPGLRSIEVWLSYAPWMSPDPTIILEFHRTHPPAGIVDPTSQYWSKWFVETFPPEIMIHFSDMTHYE